MSHVLGAQYSLTGIELGHYRILEKIGAGGMGEVYLAEDKHLDRQIAIKVLPLGTLADEQSRRRFRNEALALSRLNHPNIATVHDFDTQEGLDFLVMEYIPGLTLSKKLDEGPLPEKQVIALGTQLAEGLSAAHGHSVVHRDLKPGNLRLTNDGRLKILDFGLAMLRASTTASVTTESLTETAGITGSLPYMAPEQVQGREIDPRTDIHAMGTVLYEMATGQRPFTGANGLQLINAILRSSPPPADSLNPGLSPELSRIIAKCLEKEPENRYQSAGEIAVDLRRLARECEPQEITREPSISWLSVIVRHRAAIAAAVGIAIFLLVAIFFLARMRKAPPAARVEPSIAVLPFVDLSPEKNQEYFSDGLAEELLNSLAKTQGLRVAARTSSFQFKGKNEDLRVIGQKLNVATVLEGSVRKQGNHLRITVQLIQTSDGFHLWSDTYDRDLTDVFAVQEDIARSVAGSLQVTLLGGKAPAPRTTTIEAYNAYLQGQYFYARPTPENIAKAIAFAEQTIRLDPNYAPAWALLSRARGFQAGSYGPISDYNKAREEAERALALDPNLADAHAAIGEIELVYDWDWAGAETSYQRALALEPGNARVIGGAADIAATLNYFEEALRLGRKRVELDPLDAGARHDLALNALWAGRLDEAEAETRKGLELDPNYPWQHMVLSRVYLAKFRSEEALEEAEREIIPGFRLQAVALANHALARKQESDKALEEMIAKFPDLLDFQVAEVYAFRGEADPAFIWLERAYEHRDPGLVYTKGDPLLKNLEHDPRHAAFLKKMRLLD